MDIPLLRNYELQNICHHNFNQSNVKNYATYK